MILTFECYLASSFLRERC
uniref:Uncharacterized protein n=1 Tax=Arundo donax TaxID=35708 RepID=A0A0A9FZR5_ARUDO